MRSPIVPAQQLPVDEGDTSLADVSGRAFPPKGQV
jgi:hypothetical protein